MKIINDYMKRHRGENGKPKWLVSRIKCNDGFSMSVQASECAYCAPKINDGYYYEVEVGFPSEKELLLMAYAEDPENPTETVYGYVQAAVVEDVIEKHGGIQE